MIITISGPPGSGKTTVAELLAERTGFELISAGKRFREMAKDRNMTLSQFGEQAREDHSIDMELDLEIVRRVKEHIKDGRNAVADGRLTGQMLRREGIDALKVWIDCPLEVRAHRVSNRDGILLGEARRNIIEREAVEGERYQSIYNINLRDPHVYDLIIDSSKETPGDIVDVIIEKMEEWENR